MYKVGDIVKTIHGDTTKEEAGIIVEAEPHGRTSWYYRIKFFNYIKLCWYCQDEIQKVG
jgi:hypothetical protein